jgi:hypothetical protein
MSEVKDLGELHHALVANFRLKAKILSILFGAVLALQLSAMTFVVTQTDLMGNVIPIRMAFIGPAMLILFFSAEIIVFRYLKRIQRNNMQLRRSFTYLSTFVEVSFPCSVMFIIGSFMAKASVFPPMQIVNSPLLITLLIMIILSSLLLDPRLSFFAGLVGGIEYLSVNIFFLKRTANVSVVDFGNAGVKSAFIIVTGLLVGLVSKKIREAIISSLESKNELIHNLDKRVHEKTVEVVAQKNEIENKNILLEEKQKEILDSIHYAKRIQRTLLPSETYIGRHIKLHRKK